MMFNTQNNQWVRAIWQMSAIMLIGAAVGLCVNQLRPDHLPLTADWSAEAQLTPENGEQMVISLTEAEKLFRQKQAIFMDARSREDYGTGHIKGARSLPWHDVEERFIEATEDISPDILIIAYCDGETCGLSKNLAFFLEDMGFNNVQVLVNGWSLWQQSRLPVEVSDTDEFFQNSNAEGKSR